MEKRSNYAFLLGNLAKQPPVNGKRRFAPQPIHSPGWRLHPKYHANVILPKASRNGREGTQWIGKSEKSLCGLCAICVSLEVYSSTHDYGRRSIFAANRLYCRVGVRVGLILHLWRPDIDTQAVQDVMDFSRKIRLTILLLVLGCAAGCDQTSKHLARSGLDHFGPVILPGGFGELRLAENPGCFLSLGDSLPKPLRLTLFTVGTGVFLLGLFAYLVGVRHGRYHFIGLALIWVGGMSNFIDRVTRHGLVTDFVIIRIGPLHTGVFNAADVMTMVGLAILIYHYSKRMQTGIQQPPAKTGMTNQPNKMEESSSGKK